MTVSKTSFSFLFCILNRFMEKEKYMRYVRQLAKRVRDYALQTSYREFQDRRKAVAICYKLFPPLPESQLIVKLFNNGLGECLIGAPYTTSEELAIMKKRVSRFLDRYSVVRADYNGILEFVSLFTMGESLEAYYREISAVMEQQKQKKLGYEEQKKNRIVIEKPEDLDTLDAATVDYLSTSLFFEGTVIPSLNRFVNLKRLYLSIPVSIEWLSKLDLSRIEDLDVVISEADADIVLYAPNLETLHLSVSPKSEQDVLLEDEAQTGLFCLKIQADKLKTLRLAHMKRYDLSKITDLPNLEECVLTYTAPLDFSWLSGCKKLRRLCIYNSACDICQIPSIESLKELDLSYMKIEAIDEIAYFTNLEVLILRGNKIKRISDINNLQHVKHLDLSGNLIESSEDIKGLQVPELVLTETDHEWYQIESDMSRILYDAYLIWEKKEYNQDQMMRYERHRWMERSAEENFEYIVNHRFKYNFYYKNPTRCIRDYTPQMKQHYLDYARENYPYIKLDDEYAQQIQMEERGITYDYHERAGEIIYINNSLYRISVCLEAGKSGIKVTFENSDSARIKEAELEKIIRRTCGFIDLSNSRLHIRVFDLYRSGELKGVELGIAVAVYAWKNQISIPKNTWIAGGLNKDWIIKKSKDLSERMLKLGKQQGLEQVYYFTGYKSERIEKAGVSIHYCNDFEALINPHIRDNVYGV